MGALAFLKGIYNGVHASKEKFKNVNLQWVKTLGSKQKSGACRFFLSLMNSWNWIHICGLDNNNKSTNENNREKMLELV